MSVTNMILIDGECPIGGVCEIGDLNVKSLKRAQATIHFNAMIEEDEMNGGNVWVGWGKHCEREGLEIGDFGVFVQLRWERASDEEQDCECGEWRAEDDRNSI
ncbi:uncharacterized protein MONOS_17314 [Monocercomonoides exilis]|uniref:uncharacterized protein n=1 Tax=Monocercomonoides exilis TaxID=2049356 RepID=UPI0035595D8C|nr:hypothetical protein MONOS_17314 [Monocercomonoides exilis]